MGSYEYNPQKSSSVLLSIERTLSWFEVTFLDFGICQSLQLSLI